jgi:hypothetical protein
LDAKTAKSAVCRSTLLLHAFADATRFGFTDYEKEGIPVEYEALLRLLPLEFPDGRVKVVNQ